MIILFLLCVILLSTLARAILRRLRGMSHTLKPGDAAPLFSAKDHHGCDFSLASRKGRGWTVLYFYPKASTPGCTKQACGFRDGVEGLRKLGAEVYGVSADTVEGQAKFHARYALTFPLLADSNGEIIRRYGAKIPFIGLAKRWTFIVDPALQIRAIERNVNPAEDARSVAELLRTLAGNR